MSEQAIARAGSGGAADSAPEPASGAAGCFEPSSELPGGTTVLEASAGTGKTFVIAALATRALADGRTTIDRLMLVTFARSASLELRSRVHERLQTSLAALDAALAGQDLRSADPGAASSTGQATPDEVLAELCAADPEVLRARVARLEQALGDFDRATIATTHEFCARLLDELGMLVDHDTDVHAEQQLALLRRQVVDDVLLARSLDDLPAPQVRIARELGEAVLCHRGLPLLDPPPGNAEALARFDFAASVRAEFDRRVRLRRLHGFDDMVLRVVAALLDPVTGERAARTLAARYDLVMVDEFQDTDPAQWTILRKAFHSRTQLVIVGDPKQSIYSFRGADVQAYLDATGQADHRFTLECNHRSDPGVTQGLAELFGSAGLGSAGQDIRLTPVTSRHRTPRVRIESSHSHRPAVQLRAVSPQRPLRAATAREAIAADLVREFDSLLARTEILSRGRWRGLRPSDCAVLVRRRVTGEQIQQALIGAGIPAVFTGGEGIFSSTAAQAWLTLLDAALDPRLPRLLQLSGTPLVGWSAERLARALDDDRNELMVLVKMLRLALREQGPTGAFEMLSARTGLVPRLLSEGGEGERLLTDLRQVTERLEQAVHQERLDVVALREWLFEHIDTAGRSPDDDAVRRLETDLPAVTVMTIHKAKGLQFPVVALPDMADRFVSDTPQSRLRRTLVHDHGRLVLDLFGDLDPERDETKLAEEQAEDLRLLYVAATRAQSRVIAWWANTRRTTDNSPLHRLVTSTGLDGRPPAAGVPGGRDPQQWPLDRELVEVVSVPRPSGLLRAPGPSRDIGELGARSFHDHIDRAWARNSYTRLTAGAHDPGLPEQVPGGDEPELDPGIPATAGTERPTAAQESTVLAQLPGGTQFGSLVHSILEEVDPASPALERQLTSSAQRMLARWPVAGIGAEQLASGLRTVLRTSLGQLTHGRSLADLGATNRLAELEFEMPLGSSSRRRELADLAALWEDPALVPPDDPLAEYGSVLAHSGVSSSVLAGWLTGSIDVLLRVPPAQLPDNGGRADPASSRYVVLDYKTNRIPVPAGHVLGPHDYTRKAMAEAMIAAHYPLQALLYCVAAHRFLRRRLPGYRPGTHLGGVGYLFVRGMDGSSAGARASELPGIFSWHPQAALVEAASRVLAGGDPR